MIVRSFRTKRFRECFDKLPEPVRRKAVETFEVFRADPRSPALDRCKTSSAKLNGIERIRVGHDYRAFFRRGVLPEDDDNVYVWEWIGEYNEVKRFYSAGFVPSAATKKEIKKIMNAPTPAPKAPETKRVDPPKTTTPAVLTTPAFATAVVRLRHESPSFPAALKDCADAILGLLPIAKKYEDYLADSEKDLAVAVEIGRKEKATAEIARAEAKRIAAELEVARAKTNENREKARDFDAINERVAKLAADLEGTRRTLEIRETKIRELDGMLAKAATPATAAALEKANEEIVRLKSELRACGAFCPHCGKDRKSGLRPGETS